MRDLLRRLAHSIRRPAPWARRLPAAALAGLLAGSLPVRTAAAHAGPPFPILVDRGVGPYVASVWTDPDIGTGIFFVVLQAPEGRRLPARTAVRIGVAPVSGRLAEVFREAVAQPVHEGARYYAEVPFDQGGTWRVRVLLDGSEGGGELAAEVEATPDGTIGPGTLALYLLPFLAVGGLWLKATLLRRQAARREPGPRWQSRRLTPAPPEAPAGPPAGAGRGWWRFTMARRHRFPVVLPVLFLALLAAAGPAAPAGRERFSESTSVVAVEVPVTVLQDGKPVRGLTRDDFIVEDGRARQTITGFEVVDLQAPEVKGKPVARVPAAGRRHFLMLFDLTFSEPASMVKARDAAKRLLDGSLHPTDLVAVATYTSSQRPRLVLGFTSDPRQVRRAIDSLGLSQLGDRYPDPLGLILDEIEAHGAQAADSKGGVEAMMMENIRTFAQREAQGNRERQKNSIAAFTRSVADLAKLVGSVEGRKHVVYLSEGFDSSLVLGTADEKRVAEINEAATFGELSSVDSEERFGNTKSTSDLTRMLEEFRRADCTIQAVDIGGLRAGAGAEGRAKGEDSLFMMANGTGGELYRNFNDLEAAMSDLLQRTSVTYLLTFQPTDPALDGKYHRLRVRLKDDGGGRRVLHRPGYYAARPFAEQSGLERQLAGAGLVLGGADGGTVPVSVLAAPYRVAGQKAYVPVLVEIDGAGLAGGVGTAGGGQGALQAELYAYAFDGDGKIHDRFGQALGLDLAKVGPALRQGGLKYYGHLDLDPGEYVVRVLVRDGRGGHGVATSTVAVPAFDAATALLLPPLFPDPPAPNRWLLVREAEARQKLRQVDYPFVIGDQPFIPAARPVVPAGGEARLALVGWGIGGGAVTAEAQVFAADGARKDGGEIRLEPAAPGVAGSAQLLATYRPGALPAGAYTLVVTLTDPASGRKQTSSIPVEIAAAGAAAGR